MNRDDDIQRIVLLTGATGAIGRELAQGLLRRGRDLILACRNEEKGLRLVEKLKKDFPDAEIRLLQLDLTSEKSAIEAANALKDIRLEGIIHNAGVMNRHYKVCDDGHELTLQVNYRNTRILNELIKNNVIDGGCIIFTTSLTRFMSSGKQAPTEVAEENFSQLGTYGLSKRLLTNYAARLAKRLESRNIRVNCADPGIVNTGMIHMERWYDRLADLEFRPFIRSPRHGALPALRAFDSDKSQRIFCRFVTHSLKEFYPDSTQVLTK